MTEERIRDRIDWVHEGLLGWLNSIYGLQGFRDTCVAYQNSQPGAQQISRLSHYWVVLGDLIWERAELSLYQSAPEALIWTNVREFQRDIMTWVKVWQDCHYLVPGSQYPVRMSSILNLLINQLHGYMGSVEVSVVDPNDELIHIWVRLKNYPDSFACMISLPKITSHTLF